MSLQDETHLVGRLLTSEIFALKARTVERDSHG